MAKVVKLDVEQVSPGGDEQIGYSEPYTVEVTVRGVCPILFHRWNVEAVETKAKAAKGSTAKKTDDTESYLYRGESGEVCSPGEYLRQSIINAAKFKQGPAQPRKLGHGPVQGRDHRAPDRSRLARPGSAGLLRQAPGDGSAPGRHPRSPGHELRAGKRTVAFMGQPAGIHRRRSFLRQVLDDAGRLVGVGDFRPTYGRFTCAGWKLTGIE